MSLLLTRYDHHCVVADKVDDDDRVHLDVVDGYHGDNNSFGGSGDEVGVAAWIM